jgi:DNA modification methylase
VLVWTYKNVIGTQTKKSYRTNWQAIFYLYGKSADDLHTNSMLEKFAVKEINAPDGRQGNRYFKWQKPNELAAQLIKHSTKESQLVIDPFAGSGTFLIEAAKLGRVAKGSEINKEVIDIAVQRGCEKCF